MQENQTNSGMAISNAPEKNVAVKSQANTLLQSVELDPNSIPDLDDAEVLPIDLLANYWTPEKIGEKKRVYFDDIRVQQMPDFDNPDVIVDLRVIFFYEKSNGEIKTVCNASSRLISVIENTNMKRGTPIEIEYLGKQKNKSNNFQSDNWSVKPLMLKPAQNG